MEILFYTCATVSNFIIALKMVRKKKCFLTILYFIKTLGKSS